MDRPVIRKKKGPEAQIQERLIGFLERREWFVKETHGNMYQSGFPDLWACHKVHGQRWIEVKFAECYSFTPAQTRDFPIMDKMGVGIWILVDASQSEYNKLFDKPNWYYYYWMLNYGGIRAQPERAIIPGACLPPTPNL
jgi:hypothetical protein